MDHVGESIKAGDARWSFGGSVPKHFDQHVKKSVPLYDLGHELIVKVSDYFLTENAVVYDIGCSTGTLIEKIAEKNAGRDLRMVGIDSQAEMIEQAKKNLSHRDNVELVAGDVLDLEFEKADLIICFYTMQFIHPKRRQLLFNKIYDSLNWGGGFLLFEKVRAPDARFQDLASGLYTEFKLDQGYTPAEIVAKSRSLKGVLEPFSTQANLDLMQRAGFVDMMSIMKYVCFEGFLAVK